MQIIDAIEDLKKADRVIKKSHRYVCGLTEKFDGKDERADFFFESPDGQNGELYYLLKDIGWKHRKYDAQYYWIVYKNDFEICYTEGDVYIRKSKIK